MHDAGILHGNLRLDNLHVNDSGDVTIVDFDHANISLDKSLFFEERRLLESLLKAAVDPPTRQKNKDSPICVHPLPTSDHMFTEVLVH